MRDRSVSAGLALLLDGRGVAVDACLTTDGVHGELVETVGRRRIAEFNTGNIKGGLVGRRGVRAPLIFGGEVDTLELVPSEN